ATLSQRANNAIVATQTASTFFIMPAIFAGHVAQLKMPRLDAYSSHAPPSRQALQQKATGLKSERGATPGRADGFRLACVRCAHPTR
ncbi:MULTISPECIES: hypothetical protein, partial [Acidovorax]|uniref:hypothetical protein n=1 Tax=Acidovorax TaxID=12916 RepID=UPI001EE45D16